MIRVALQVGSQLEGGMSRYAHVLAAALARRADVAVVPVGPAKILDVLDEQLGRPQQRIEMPDGQLREGVVTRGLLRRRLARRADLFHGTRHLVPLWSPVPTVLTVHDVGPLADDAFTPAKRLLLPDQYRRSLRGADALVAVSQTTRQRLLAHLPEVADAVTVIPTPAPTAVVGADPVQVDRVARMRRFFLYVGDLSPRKDVGFLLDLWADIGARLGAPLVLAGADGWRSEPVRAAIAVAESSGHVTRLGVVSDGELRWLYEHAAAVVSASRYEGTGLPIAEALALGTPVVINDEPALQETAAGAATVVPTTDPQAWEHALLQLVTDPPERRPRPAAGEGPWVDAVVAVYRGLLAARRSASA